MRKELLEQLRIITKEEQEILGGRDSIDPEIYNLNRSMVVDAGKLLAAGKLIELRPHTRFIDFPKHTHNYVEVVYMCQGQTHHKVNGTPITLRAGELLFMSQNTTQEIEAAGMDDIAVNFIILPGFFEQVLAMIGAEKSMIRDFLIDCLRNGQHDVSYLHFQVADVLMVQNLMENLVASLLDGHYSQRLNQTTLALVILHLMDYTERLDIGRNHFEQEQAIRIFRYIDEHYHDGSLAELATSMHYDSPQMSRLIKKVTGYSYKELLQEKRLSQAAYLLKETTLPITDISMDVGYNNFSYFYRLFEEKYGVTPKAYRIGKIYISRADDGINPN